ncbi:MAG: hypothetical protein A2202_08535 [Bdellovibrionales bacterium RIFOXYA1_FULL_36_14]|nr:MAG: hypothetical protein A2202_08535 [Bdellovibrionales bacterium RIFOXYA1_FULL_36_14]
MKKLIYSSVGLVFFFILVLGVLYPVSLVYMGEGVLKAKSLGSFIFDSKSGKIIGSELIGQNWINPRYFWGRPSINSYDPMNSGGSQFAPISLQLKNQIEENSKKYSSEGENIPEDLLLSSGSGLDPHISVEGAIFQISRIARERKLNEERIRLLVLSLVEKKTFGVLGQDRINVLKLNQKLDQLE